MKLYSFVLVALFLLAGSYHVAGMSCEDALKSSFQSLEGECNSGARADAFLEFNPSESGLSAAGAAIAEKCIADAKAKPHAKCKRFADLYNCYLTSGICAHIS
uniref:LolSALOa n=1 Tax=Bichromomyia olmeca TaxID=715919 RepID=A0A1B1V3F1_9DIPT|nr:LolSALOa [Bichromomyia olmeca]